MLLLEMRNLGLRDQEGGSKVNGGWYWDSLCKLIVTVNGGQLPLPQHGE